MNKIDELYFEVKKRPRKYLGFFLVGVIIIITLLCFLFGVRECFASDIECSYSDFDILCASDDISISSDGYVYYSVGGTSYCVALLSESCSSSASPLSGAFLGSDVPTLYLYDLSGNPFSIVIGCSFTGTVVQVSFGYVAPRYSVCKFYPNGSDYYQYVSSYIGDSSSSVSYNLYYTNYYYYSTTDSVFYGYGSSRACFSMRTSLTGSTSSRTVGGTCSLAITNGSYSFDAIPALLSICPSSASSDISIYSYGDCYLYLYNLIVFVDDSYYLISSPFSLDDFTWQDSANRFTFADGDEVVYLVYDFDDSVGYSLLSSGYSSYWAYGGSSGSDYSLVRTFKFYGDGDNSELSDMIEVTSYLDEIQTADSFTYYTPAAGRIPADWDSYEVSMVYVNNALKYSFSPYIVAAQYMSLSDLFMSGRTVRVYSTHSNPDAQSGLVIGEDVYAEFYTDLSSGGLLYTISDYDFTGIDIITNSNAVVGVGTYDGVTIYSEAFTGTFDHSYSIGYCLAEFSSIWDYFSAITNNTAMASNILSAINDNVYNLGSNIYIRLGYLASLGDSLVSRSTYYHDDLVSIANSLSSLGLTVDDIYDYLPSLVVSSSGGSVDLTNVEDLLEQIDESINGLDLTVTVVDSSSVSDLEDLISSGGSVASAIASGGSVLTSIAAITTGIATLTAPLGFIVGSVNELYSCLGLLAIPLTISLAFLIIKLVQRRHD